MTAPAARLDMEPFRFAVVLASVAAVLSVADPLLSVAAATLGALAIGSALVTIARERRAGHPIAAPTVFLGVAAVGAAVYLIGPVGLGAVRAILFAGTLWPLAGTLRAPSGPPRAAEGGRP